MFLLPSPYSAVGGLLYWISQAPPPPKPLVGNPANEWRHRMTGMLNEEQLDWRDEGGGGGMQTDTESWEKKFNHALERHNGLVSFPKEPPAPRRPSRSSLRSASD